MPYPGVDEGVGHEHFVKPFTEMLTTHTHGSLNVHKYIPNYTVCAIMLILYSNLSVVKY